MQEELDAYSSRLLEKPALVVANKMDLLDGGDHKDVVRELQSSTDMNVIAISARGGEGVDDVRQALMKQVQQTARVAA